MVAPDTSIPIVDEDTPPETASESTGRFDGWPMATAVFWGLVFVAVVGVWKASQEVGVATWWRGPRGASRPVLVQILPLVAPAVMVVGALFHWRRLPWLGLGAAAVTAAIGAGDLAVVPQLAVVEIALGAAGALFSLAALAARRATRR